VNRFCLVFIAISLIPGPSGATPDEGLVPYTVATHVTPGRDIFKNPLDCQNPLIAVKASLLAKHGCPSCGNPLSFVPRPNGNVAQCMACATYSYPARETGEWIQIVVSEAEKYLLRSLPHPAGPRGETLHEIVLKVRPLKAFRLEATPQITLARDVFTGESLEGQTFWILLETEKNEDSHLIAGLFPVFSVRLLEGGVALPAGRSSLLKLSLLLEAITQTGNISHDLIYDTQTAAALPSSVHPLLLNALDLRQLPARVQ
jgi:hypothetical protein